MNHSSIACRSEPKKTSLHGILRTALVPAMNTFSKSSPASYRSHTSCTAAMTPPGVVGVVVAKGRCRFHHLLMQQRLAAVHCHQSRTVGNARMRPFELANLFAESFETLPLYSSIAANIGSRLISHSSKGSAKSNSHMASRHPSTSRTANKPTMERIGRPAIKDF